MLVHFLRHLPCRGNVQGYFVGQRDEELVSAGAAPRLNISPVQSPVHVFSSPLKRCTQTVEVLAAQLMPSPVILLLHSPDERLKERGLGLLEGRMKEEIYREHAPRASSASITLEAVDPSVEKPSVFFERVRACARDLKAAWREARPGASEVVIVAHLHVFRVLVPQLLGNDTMYDTTLSLRHGESLAREVDP